MNDGRDRWWAVREVRTRHGDATSLVSSSGVYLSVFQSSVCRKWSGVSPFLSLLASFVRRFVGSLRLTSSSFLLPERMSKVSGNVVNREPNEAATEGERNLWMVDFIMDFMGFFCYFHNKIHNKSTYKIIKNNKCRNDPKNPKIKKINEKKLGVFGVHFPALLSHSCRSLLSLVSSIREPAWAVA